MPEDCVDWTYSNMCDGRIADLSAPVSYAQIVDWIAADVKSTDVKFSIDLGRCGLVKDCLRPEFRFPVERDLGDLFFNGLAGYRAHYYRSKAAGEAANRRVINAMHDLLLDAAEMANFKYTKKGKPLTRSPVEIDYSLGLPSAKIWPSECKDLNPELYRIIYDPDLPPIQINADRWLEFARKGIGNAEIGVCAPEIRFLEIKGAFVNETGEERISEDKVLRSCEIHMLGFS